MTASGLSSFLWYNSPPHLLHMPGFRGGFIVPNIARHCLHCLLPESLFIDSWSVSFSSMTRLISVISSSASACGSVLGNPSNIMPCFSSEMRFLISFIIWASENSFPVASCLVIFSSCAAVSRSRSPVDRWIILYSSLRSCACVPLPEPCVPSIIMFILNTRVFLLARSVFASVRAFF